MPQDYLGIFLVWQPSPMSRIGPCLSSVCSQLAAVNTLLGRPRGVPVGTGAFFRGCSTGHLPRTALDRSCLDVPALSSVQRPIVLSSAPSRDGSLVRLPRSSSPLPLFDRVGGRFCAMALQEPLGFETKLSPTLVAPSLSWDETTLGSP